MHLPQVLIINLADWNALLDRHNEVVLENLLVLKLPRVGEHVPIHGKAAIVGASLSPHGLRSSGRVQKNKPQGKAKGKEKGIYTIELFAFPKNSWVYDTGCGTHICNTKQGLRGAKKLKRGSLYLHVSKKGASYFITFTDDYSRYGYVYLLKHKHEVFETFKKVDKTPYELWHGKVPNLSTLRSGDRGTCENGHTPDKLQQRSVKCIFVGYPKKTMGYYFYYPPENKIVVERYADFLEKDFILQKESGRNVELDDEDILPSENTSEHPIKEESLAPIVSQEEDVVLIRRSVRTHKAPNRLCLNVEIDPDRLSFNIEVEEHSLGDLNEPANYKAALSDPEFEKWLVANDREMQSMNDNKVWKLVVLPPNANCLKVREAAFILGIKIYRDRSRRLIGLSQNAYLDKILKRCRMDNSKRGSIPMQVDLHLNKSQCATTSAEMKRMQNVPYASAVGYIMYAVRCTRPDVAFAQNITSRFQQNPGEAHWIAVKNILKYLRNTKDMFLVYGGNPVAELQVKCYCDARFETDRDDTKS
ncbi:hypothetical protein Tco_1105961 [Tanacetum coccineum]